MKKSCPEKEVHPPAESTEKIVDPSHQGDPAGRVKVFVRRNARKSQF